uniref:Uncharacterized protein n=1 Tax=Triticum urartu TaxID=4572 RepID=A0A8R7PZ03_TRIUA
MMVRTTEIPSPASQKSVRRVFLHWKRTISAGSLSRVVGSSRKHPFQTDFLFHHCEGRCFACCSTFSIDAVVVCSPKICSSWMQWMWHREQM